MNTFFKPRALLLSCSLLLCAPLTQADTLKDIYQEALTNDHEYLAAKAALNAGRESALIGRSGILPNVSASASWQQSSGNDNAIKQIPDPNNDGQFIARQVGDFDGESIQYGVTVRQALFDMAAWSTFRNGQAISNLADATYVSAEQALVLRSATAYFDVLRANDNLRTAQAEEAALSHQLEQSKQRFEVGLTAITEVHEAQSAFDSATAQRLVAEGALGIAFEALEVLTGETHKQLAPLVEKFKAEHPQPMARQEWVDKALQNNAALKIAQYRTDAAEALAKASKRGHLPTLYASATYGGQESENNGFTSQDSTATTVGLQLSVPIFGGGRISASRRQAYQQFVEQSELFAKAERDTVQTARISHLNVLTSVATVKALKQAIVSSQSALEATQAGYDVGTRDLVDVLNAQRALYAAQRDYYNALYGYILNTLSLKQAAGTLGAEDINQLNQWLDTSKSVTYQG